jgi:Flp pilus assembly protein TadG
MDKKRPELSLLKLVRLQGFKAGSQALWGRMRALGRNESGAVAIITAILMVVFLGFLALAVDIGHLATVKNELQNAADASALAGARALVFKEGEMVQKITPLPDPPYCGQAKTWAQTTINQSDAQNLTITTVQTGVWDWKASTFTINESCGLNSGVNAVHVEVQRNDAANQPVATWFARIFGVDTVNAGARATAAIGYLAGMPAYGTFPIALTLEYFDELKNGDPGDIMFYPDNADTGGWCGPTSESITPPNLIDWINGGIPEALTENVSEVSLNNGNLTPGINAIKNHELPWQVVLPVVNTYGDALNQTGDVVSFALVTITGAYTPNEKNNPWNIEHPDLPPRFVITFTLDEKNYSIEGGESGGKESNLFATQPKLVQ